MKVSGVKDRNTSAFLNGKHNSILEIEKIMETKQKEISELSKRHPRLETLMYRVNKDSLNVERQIKNTVNKKYIQIK